MLAERGIRRYQAEKARVEAEIHRVVLRNTSPGWDATQALADARRREPWLPDESAMLPTALGNTLYAGEVRAGERYGLRLATALPRLIPQLSPSIAGELRDRRNQLDAAVRLSTTFAIATAVGLGLLLQHGRWLVLPLLTYLACWTSYVAAVAAARGFCTALATAVDLHHLGLFDALRLQRPSNLQQEIAKNELLGRLMRGEPLSRSEKTSLMWLPVPAEANAGLGPSGPGEGKSER